MSRFVCDQRQGQLQRIEGGDFGFCAICDADIDPKRLRVDPALTRCIKCSAWSLPSHSALRCLTAKRVSVILVGLANP